MPFAYRRRNARPVATAPTHTTGTRTTRSRGLFSRRGARAPATTTATKRGGILGGKKTEVHHHHHHHHNHIGGASAPVRHQQRRPTMKDKVSGAFLKLKGSLTHRRGQKAAGTRRMHGTDGRTAHRRRW